MQRRTFLKNTLLATGAISLTSLTATSCSNSTNTSSTTSGTGEKKPLNAPLRKSIMWGTVSMEGSVLDKCKAIKAAGFDGIEPNSHMNREEVLAAMKETGLAASSVCNSKHWEFPLSSPDPEVRRKGIEAMIVAMEDAKAYGTDAVLLVPGKVDANVNYEDCWNRATEAIKELIPTAEKLKVKMCLENVWNNFILSPMEARIFVDQFKSDYVRFYFDCGNILVYGWPEQWINVLGDRVGRIHIKEFSREKADKEGRWTGFGVPLTEGNVDWKKVMTEIRNSYAGGWLTTEQGGSASLEELQDLHSRLEKVMAM